MLELNETTFDASCTGHQRCVEDLVGAFDKHNEMVDICGLKNKFGKSSSKTLFVVPTYCLYAAGSC
jgi:hypothetical protein